MDRDPQYASPPDYIDPLAYERLKHELELLTSAIRLVHPECDALSSAADARPAGAEPFADRRLAG